MRRLFVLLLLFTLFTGCTQNAQSNSPAGAGGNAAAGAGGDAANGGGNSGNYADNGGDYIIPPEIYFWPSGILPDAVIGAPYKYSFCDPEPSNVNALCGSPNDSISPSNGHYPYHFTLDSGTGFAPMGLTLQLNGLLTGTPTTAGTSVFGVCAVDLDGLQKCANVSLTVKKPIELTVHFTGTGTGTVTVISENKSIICKRDCTIPFAENYAQAALPFLPDSGSAFGGWSGDCTGNRPCTVNMGTEDKTVTANFEKFDVQVTSATCTYVPSGGYDFLIKVSATATGPKNSYLSMDFAHYNGFMDMAYSCGSWASQGNGAYCRNDGAGGSTHWSTSFRMGSPRDDSIIHPFDWNPSMNLAVGYDSDNTFYGLPGVEDPKNQQIIVPMKIHCD